MNGKVWLQLTRLVVKSTFFAAFLINSGAAQTLPASAIEASRVWAEIEAQETGLYIGDGFLFAVAELPWIGNPRRVEARAARLINNLLVNHLLLSSLQDDHQKGVASILLQDSNISSRGQYHIRLRSHVLESGPKARQSDIFRRVVAVPIKQNNTNILSATDTLQAYSSLVSTLVQNWLNHPRVFEKLGLHSMALIAKRHQLSQSANTLNILAPGGDPIALRAQYQDYLDEGRFDTESLTHWPGEYQVTAKQVTLAGSDRLTALAWDSISCVDPRSSFTTSYRHWAAISRIGDASRQINGYVVQRAIRCLGFIDLDELFPSEVPEFFPELERVFREGRDLQAALSLAHKAVERAPRFAESWGYLGAAYQASGNDELAMVFARARLSLEPTSKKALLMYLSLIESGDSDNRAQFASDLKLAVSN